MVELINMDGIIDKYELLNDALNKALVGKNKIKGVISSNKIADFVDMYIEENSPKKLEFIKKGDFIKNVKLSGSNKHLYTVGKKYQVIKMYNPRPKNPYWIKFVIIDDNGKEQKIRSFLPLSKYQMPVDDCLYVGFKYNPCWTPSK